MISPELLRRYPFFGALDDSELKTVAMISEEESAKEGAVLLEERRPADALYMLIDGSVELCFSCIKDEYPPKPLKYIRVGDISPGEPFGFSALIEPYTYTSTAKAAAPCRFIRIDAVALRQACEQDPQLAYKLIQQVAKVALERLTATRVQLAAAWTER